MVVADDRGLSFRYRFTIDHFASEKTTRLGLRECTDPAIYVQLRYRLVGYLVTVWRSFS